MRDASGAVAAVLFDLDGTLVETAPEICDAVNDTLDRLRLRRATLQQVEGWIGHGATRVLQQAIAHATGWSVEQVRNSSLWRFAQPRFAQEYERRSGTTSRPYPHARELLRELGERGVARALVTNKEQRYAIPVLRRHGLRPLFERVVCGDSLPTCKPDPAGVQACLHALGVAPARAVFVGDSAVDVATARNAGVAAWALTHGYNGGQPIAAAAPDRLLPDLRAVLAALDEDAPARAGQARARSAGFP